MLRRIVLCAVMIFAALLPAACNMPARRQGPITWIDQPLDGTHFPLGTLTLQAHASDEDGVVAIEFFVGKDRLQTAPVSGGRLGDAMIEWTPPGNGNYTISASGVDGQGNPGDKASVQISVGDVSVTATLLESNITATPTFTPTLVITPSPTLKPISSGPSFILGKNANCREGPGTVYEVIDTLFQGQTVPVEGRNTESSWFWVSMPGGGRNCWVSVVTGQFVGNMDMVQVASAPPPPEAPNEKPAEPSGSSVDTTPPTILNLSANPPSIHAQSCGGEPSTTYISAIVSDDGGVSYVAVRPSGNNEVAMNSVGGGAYQAVLGPFYDAGEFSVVIVASDNAGNSSQAGPLAITVVCAQ